MIKINSIDDDLVIKSKFLTGETNYEFAINKLYPLIDRLNIQRNLQNPSFYKRLKEDLLNGCVMPPITIAIINDELDNFPNTIKDSTRFINENIEKTFILDGIQRLNTLKTAFSQPELGKTLDVTRPLFINVLICKSIDNLLYRMITLNNGQRPMSANHQIEILLGNVYEFNELNIKIITDKEKGKRGKNESYFEKTNIIKGYLAFITDSISIDNKKIIDEKMDSLITKKIIDSDITNSKIQFVDIIKKINELSQITQNKKWFDNNNNLIGFCVGIKTSHEILNKITPIAFGESIENFENTFKALNFSSIKLSKERRTLSKYFIANFSELSAMDEYELLDNFNEYVL